MYDPNEIYAKRWGKIIMYTVYITITFLMLSRIKCDLGYKSESGIYMNIAYDNAAHD